MDSTRRNGRGGRGQRILYSAFSIALVGGVILSGCGRDGGDSDIWRHAVGTYHIIQGDPAAADDPQMRRQLADSIDRLLNDHPDAPEGLRRVLEDIRDGERQLAEGSLSAADAQALRDHHDELWSYLRQQELPPDYQ